MSFSVLENNLIRLRAEAKDPAGPGVEEVRFYVSYLDDKGNKVHRQQVGAAKSQPYEYVWDAAGIPDQDQWRLDFLIEVQSKDGSVYAEPEQWKRDRQHFYVLDRNKQFSKRAAICYRLKDPPEVDARLDEWPLNRYDTLRSSDNLLVFQAGFFKNHFYMAIKVDDKYIYAPAEKPSTVKTRNGQVYRRLWQYDAVEICFDINHDRSSYTKLDDGALFICADGSFQAVSDDLRQGTKPKVWGEDINCKVRVMGTLNQPDNKDSCYIIELAIPKESMPDNGQFKNDTIGFDLFNHDVEYKGSQRTFGSFSGVRTNCNDNPSEWANLVFEQPGTSPLTGAVFMVSVLAFGILILVLVYRSRRGGPAGQRQTKTGPLQQYIIENLSNAELDINRACSHFRMSRTTFSQHFKRESGLSFPDFVNQKRVEKAKQLLKDPSLQINEIAFKTGYNSAEHFARVFRKMTGKLPSEFRSSPF